MKKIAFLLISFLLASTSFQSWAAGIFEFDGLLYQTLDDSNWECEVVGCLSSITDLVIPAKASSKEVKGIADGAFLNNLQIKSLTVANDVDYHFYIGVQAFKGCTSLVAINLPGYTDGDYSYRVIKNEAFRACVSLTELTLPGLSLGDYAFADCTGLTTLNISLGRRWYGSAASADLVYNTMGKGAFQNCSSLTLINSKNSLLGPATAFQGCVSLQKVVAKSSPISEYAFSDLPKLQEVEMANTYMRNGAFKDCKFLRKFSYSIDSEYEQSLPVECFDGCVRLSDLNLVGGIRGIMHNAFKDCASLKELTFPSVLVDCDALAFNGCISLNSLKFLPSKKDTFIPLQIQPNTFAYLPVEYLSIGRSITGLYKDVPFADLEQLKQLEVYGDFTDIPASYFSNCPVLEKISLGPDVKTVGSRAFSGCSAVSEFICDALVPPVCGTHAFDGIDTDNCTLIVSAGCEEAYMDAPEWRKFYGFNSVEAPVINGDDTSNGVYNLNGIRVADTTEGLAPGFYIVRMGNNMEKRVVR